MSIASDLEARGWKVFQDGERWVAERFASRPGASSSVVRVEGQSEKALKEQAELREAQLSGTDAEIKDTITNDGTLVTGAQHESLRTEGLTVSGAEKVTEPVPNEDEAKQAAPFDATEGSVDAPQVPSDASDQGMSQAAVSASETGSGSADTSTDPSAQAEPATVPPPEGGSSLAGDPLVSADNADASAPADADSSEAAGSQSTPSTDATDAAKKLADEKGVDLAAVSGSGKDGKVTKPDVEAHLEAQSAPASE